MEPFHGVSTGSHLPGTVVVLGLPGFFVALLGE